MITKRRSEIARVVDRTFFDKGQQPPGNTEEELDLLAAMVNSWDEHLTRWGVPTEDIETVYLFAADTYSNRGPFTIFDMRDGWRALQEERAETAKYPARLLALGPKPCSWEHEDEEEKMTSVVFFRHGITERMPCPDCRPEAFAQRRSELLQNLKAKSIPELLQEARTQPKEESA